MFQSLVISRMELFVVAALVCAFFIFAAMGELTLAKLIERFAEFLKRIGHRKNGKIHTDKPPEDND